MILKKGNLRHKLPEPVGILEAVCFTGELQEMRRHIPQFTVHQILEAQEKLQGANLPGFPVAFAYDPKNREILVYPIPEEDVIAEIQFYPPKKKI